MHEFSLAQAIVQTVLQVAQQHGAEAVEEVNLEVGEVALVNVDQLEWHIRMLTKATLAEGARINWKKIGAQILCPECGYQGPIAHRPPDSSSHFDVPVFQCPHCGSPSTRILSGRELKVVDIHARFSGDSEDGTDA